MDVKRTALIDSGKTPGKVDDDYRAYQMDFVKLHFPAYCEKYGKPSGKSEMEAYRRCFDRDLKKAMEKDLVDKAWKRKEVCRGVIVEIIRMAHSFKNVILNPLEPYNSKVLAVYDSNEKKYAPVEKVDVIFEEIQGLTYSSYTEKQVEELYRVAARLSDKINVRCNPYEIPCENYLWDEKNKEKIPYGEGVVLMTRGHVDYDPTAENPHIFNPEDGTYWDFDSWHLDLFDGDKELEELSWQLLARAVRPYRDWIGIVLFYGTGRNGKGTLVSLYRNLLTTEVCANVPFTEFEERFGLGALLIAQIVLRDENKMSYKFDGSDRLKAAASCDPFEIERKMEKDKVSLRFPGLIIECVNELPRMRDKAKAWYDRIIILPFDKNFMKNDRLYIKDDYLKRPEVLAYVKRRAIETEIKEIRDTHLPKRSYELLEYYKTMNDPIRSFWEDMSEELVWDALPGTFLYDLYVAWYRRFNPVGKPTGRNTFYDSFQRLIDEGSDWEAKLGRNDKIRNPYKMMPLEPLIAEYDLKHWYNPVYVGPNRTQRCTGAPVPETFRGIVRVTN